MFNQADANELITDIDPIDALDRIMDANPQEDDECTECGCTLVVCLDEYSDAVICPECECEDDDYDFDGYDDYDGQPDEAQEWADFDPDC